MKILNAFSFLQYGSENKSEKKKKTYQVKNKGQKLLAIYYWTQTLLRILMKES